MIVDRVEVQEYGVTILQAESCVTTVHIVVSKVRTHTDRPTRETRSATREAGSESAQTSSTFIPNPKQSAKPYLTDSSIRFRREPKFWLVRPEKKHIIVLCRLS